MRRIIAACARNTVFVNIFMLLFFVVGIAGSIMLVRERLPQVGIDLVTVTVPFPGADPLEVEEAICTKIEEAIDGVEGVKQYTTISQENRGTAVIEVLEEYDISEVKEELTSRVDAISTFPPDAEKPIITKPVLRLDVITVALTGAEDERRLKEWAEEVKDELQALPELSQVEISGAREYEISIEVSEEALREYGLTFDQVTAAVRRGSQNLAGGTIRTQGEEIRLRTLGRKYWGDEFSKIVVLTGPRGELVTLDKVANVKDTFTEDRVMATMNGEPAVMLICYKTPREDSIAISEAVNRYVAKKKQILPAGLDMRVWHDASYFIDGSIRVLLKNSLIGITIVFLLLWLFLDLRLSFWASMGIPISLCGAMAVVWLSGNTLNVISLFGMVMVVGIIVDDAIVIGEAIYVHRKRGAGPLRAAVDGAMEVGMPVLAAVATTIIAFIPLLFVTGFMGKLIAILPIAVISCLIASTIECLVMLPAHLNHLPGPNDPKVRARQQRNPARRMRQWVGDGLEWFAGRIYVPVARWTLKRRYAAVCVAVSAMLAAAGLYQGGMLKFVMFPKMDGNMLFARMEFPSGTPLEVTRDTLQQLEDALRRVAEKHDTLTGEPLVQNVYALAGAKIKPDPGEQQQYSTNIGGLMVEMLKAHKRGVHSKEIIADWEREVGNIPGLVYLDIEGDGSGPPGKPIEIWVQGRDINEILAASETLEQKLLSFEGVSQVGSDYTPGKNEIQFKLKPAARSLGITVSDLARQVYAGFYGEEALRIQRGRDDVRVSVRYPTDERSQISELRQVRIRTPRGKEVPLLSVADVRFSPGYSTITRTDGRRRVSVSASVDTMAANTAEIIGHLQASYFGELRSRYPGITLSVQGEHLETQESLSALRVGYPIALVGIFFIVATVFRSYIQPLVILLTVPFGIVGAMFGHVVMGFPVTLFSIFGIVALSGVVVNDAIVLIECINNMIASGTPFTEALVRGGQRRFRAIFLTTISTCGGLAPMVFETDFQTQFIIPMAIALTFGVAFATLLTLLLIPSFLAILNDLRRALARVRTGAWPAPEAVEPAATRFEDPVSMQPESVHAAPVEEG